MAYLAMMAPRLKELKRVLKHSGSIFLHCDSTASHYLKMMMDAVFGKQNFRNEIIWKRSDAHNDAKRQFGMTSDRLLFYSNAPTEYTFHPQYGKYQERTLRDWYQYLEFPDGTVRRMTKQERESQTIPEGARRFNTDNLRSPNPRPNLTYDYKGYKPHRNGWAVSIEKMRELDDKGLLLFPSSKDGRIMRKRYLEENKGAVLGDVWTDISQLRGADAERLGYPTQKPEALLERIIRATTNDGDTVLDPFCGCGTAVAAAQKLNRRWIGIDVTHLAVAIIKQRLANSFGFQVFKTVKVTGEPVNIEEAIALARDDKFGFQCWAVGKIGAPPIEHKKGADRGIDGRIYFHDDFGAPKEIIISVKAGENIGPAFVRELRGVMERERAEMGIMVCIKEPTSEMTHEASRAGRYHGINGSFPKMQIITVADMFTDKPLNIPGRLNPYERKKPASVKPIAEQLRLLP
jgi:site-specific DNA-methyltransferase (adenine-specific)